MSKPRLVIHVGPRKTASTYLQQNLFLNREALEARGWLYPVIATSARNAHHAVTSNRAAILKGKGGVYKRLARAAARAHALSGGLILSSEGLSGWKPRDFERLADRLGFGRVTIVYVLRDPVSLVGSLWSESVKNGKTHSLPVFIDKFLSNPVAKGATNPAVRLEPLISSPRIDLAVLNLDAAIAAGQDIFRLFCQAALGVEGIEPGRRQTSNSRNPAEFTEFLRLLAPLAGDTKKRFGLMLGRAVERRVRPATLAAAMAAIKAQAEKAAREIVLDRDQDWHRRMQADLVGLLGDRLQPPPAADGAIFPSGVVKLVAYDSAVLARDPVLARLIEQAAAELRPGPLAVLGSRIRAAGKRLLRLAQASLSSFRR